MAVLGTLHSLSKRLFPAKLRGREAGGFCLRSLVLLVLSVVLTLAVSTPAVAQREAEINKLKAAFIFQFANFVEWPEEALGDDGDPFVICIVGNESLGEILKGAVRGKSVRGREVEIRTMDGSSDLTSCQIMFVDDEDRRDVPRVIDEYATQPVLTVGDSDDFTSEGGIIRLYPEASKLRIEINIDAAERAGLKISSKLLSLAKVVED